MKISQIILKCLLVTLCFFIVRCSSNQLVVDPKQQIIIGIESFPNQLDPRYPSDAYSGKINQLIYNGLIKYDKQLNLVPDLAERYEYITSTQLRIRLRPGLQFHNGQRLTSKDVYDTYQSILDPQTKSPLKGAFQKIKQVKIIDELSLELSLSEPFAPIFPLLTTGILPSPKKISSDSSHKKGHLHIGTGPYQFVEQKFGRWVLLKSFENFHETPAKIKWLKFEVISDETMRALKLVNGELDLVQNAIPIPMIEWLKKKPLLKLQHDPGINYKYLGFNLRDPILKNLMVRQAIAYAIDRETLIQYKSKGLARPATGVLAPENPYYSKQVLTYFFDPIRAKTLLDEAGFKDPDGDGPKMRFNLIYKTSTNRSSISMARAIAEQLKRVGIGIEIRPYEWATFYRDIRTGNFQLFSLSWVAVKDPDIFYYLFHSSQMPPKGSNRGYYSNMQIDELAELARVDTDEANRKHYYSEIQQILSQDLPYISLWYEDNYAFISKKLENYQIQPDASFYNIVYSNIRNFNKNEKKQ